MAYKSTVTIDGIEMPYGTFGDGEKKLVIIPGLSVTKVTDSINAVEKAYEVFKKDYTVYLFDRRLNAPDGYTIHDMAEDTFRVMQHLSIGFCDLIGTSQGGMIAMNIAGEHPSAVHKLVLASTCGRITEESASVFACWKALAEAGEYEKLARDFAVRIYSSKLAKAASEFLAAQSKTYTTSDIKRFIIMDSALLSGDFSDCIRRIQCNSMIVSSKGDQVFSFDVQKELCDKLGGEFCAYGEEYGHAVYDEAPDYIEKVYNFLAE